MIWCWRFDDVVAHVNRSHDNFSHDIHPRKLPRTWECHTLFLQEILAYVTFLFIISKI